MRLDTYDTNHAMIGTILWHHDTLQRQYDPHTVHLSQRPTLRLIYRASLASESSSAYSIKRKQLTRGSTSLGYLRRTPR